jgi:hypothetical protein
MNDAFTFTNRVQQDLSRKAFEVTFIKTTGTDNGH